MRRVHSIAASATTAFLLGWLVWPQASGAQEPPPGAASPSPPQVVLSTMHQVNQMEIQLGQLAEERGDREEVRRYGDRMVRDHRFGDRKVTALAERQGFEMLPPPQLPAAPKLKPMMQKAEELRQMSGPEFDRMFLQMMTQSHEMAVSMLGEALGDLPEGEVRTLVSRLRPILEQHLELAEAIQGDTQGEQANAEGTR